MRLDIVGSSSRGNCYILQSEKEALIIEMGCKFQNVLNAVGYDRSKIVGAIVSHNHSDHAKYVSELGQWNIPFAAPADVPSPHIVLKNVAKTSFGRFSVTAFKVDHNADCRGFVIEHPDMGRLLFVTDAKKIPYKFKSLDYVMCEANYDYDMYVNYPERRHGNLNHMEIGTAIAGVRNQDLSNAKRIILLHLSDGLSNAEDFKRRMEEVTGIPTTVADSGMSMEL